MTPQQMIIPIAIAVGTVILNAIININIKFAPNAHHAKDSVKRIFSRIAMFLALAWICWSLFHDVSSAAPVTRASVFSISLNIATLLFALIMSVIYRFIDTITRAFNRSSDIFERLNKVATEATTNSRNQALHLTGSAVTASASVPPPSPTLHAGAAPAPPVAEL